MLLPEFNIIYVNLTSTKGQVLADQITEGAENNHKVDESVQFLDEDILLTEPCNEKWKLYFDGAANVYGCGIGVVLVSPKGNQFLTSARLMFPYTNNVAEYEACIMGLRMAIDMKI